MRPQRTEGWHWWHELTAAMRAGVLEPFDVIESWSFEQHCDCRPPFAAIAELYRRRLELGRDSAAGRARKTIIAAVYGKLAQSSGTAAYACPVYASLITAGCRAAILDAIATHPGGTSQVLMIATDNITFRTPHPALELGEQLGQWTAATAENLSLFMPGVYWSDETRVRLAAGADPRLKSRGIAAHDLVRRIDVIDQAWAAAPSTGHWPRLIIPVAFTLTSAKQALQRGAWSSCGMVEHDATRELSASPRAKRQSMGPPYSQPYPAAPEPVSTPYDRRFGLEAEALADLEFGDHPDGPVGRVLLRNLLGGS